jgi:hypothetical protein
MTHQKIVAAKKPTLSELRINPASQEWLKQRLGSAEGKALFAELARIIARVAAEDARATRSNRPGWILRA